MKIGLSIRISISMQFVTSELFSVFLKYALYNLKKTFSIATLSSLAFGGVYSSILTVQQVTSPS